MCKDLPQERYAGITPTPCFQHHMLNCSNMFDGMFLYPSEILRRPHPSDYCLLAPRRCWIIPSILVISCPRCLYHFIKIHKPISLGTPRRSSSHHLIAPIRCARWQGLDSCASIRNELRVAPFYTCGGSPAAYVEGMWGPYMGAVILRPFILNMLETYFSFQN